MTLWPPAAIRQAVAPWLPALAIETVASIDSTNSELMRRARAGSTAPVLLVAEVQTHGRGRRGRLWHGAPGQALTFSLGLPLAPRDWSGLSLVAGVAVAEALHTAGAPGIGLKWPNDLWLSDAIQGDRKLGGILVETAAIDDAGPHEVAIAFNPQRRYAVIGIGINLNQPAHDAALSMPPAALSALAPGLGNTASALRAVVPALVAAVHDFEARGFAPFRHGFDTRDMLRDRPVVLSDGTAGTAHGVDDGGALLVHTARGMQSVTSAEVSVRPRFAPRRSVGEGDTQPIA